MEYIDWSGLASQFSLGSFAGFAFGCILGCVSLGINGLLESFRDL